MSDRSNELRLAAVDAAVAQGDFFYRNLSPRIGFAEGGVHMLERMVQIDEQFVDYESATDSHAVLSGGWLSLEIAAHLPRGRARTTHLEQAEARFNVVADRIDAPLWEDRYAAHVAHMGMTAFAAYTEPVQKVKEDNPGVYAMLLESLTADNVKDRGQRGGIRPMKTLGKKFGERTGLLSEIVVATLGSKAGRLVLPASSRHDKALSIIKPNHRFDFSVWNRPWSRQPGTADALLQVKTNAENDRKWYADHITPIDVSTDLGLEFEQLPALAHALVQYYNGGVVSADSLALMAIAKKSLCVKLAGSGYKQSLEYSLRADVKMRGTTKNGREGQTLHLKR